MNTTINCFPSSVRPRAKCRVALSTVHEGLTTGFADLTGEMRAGFADLKVTLISGFQALPTRESSEEMVRLLRENNRLQEQRFTRLDVRIREQHLEILQALRAVADGQRVIGDSQRVIIDGQGTTIEALRALSEEVRSLSADIRALIARLDALIRGRGDGSPAGQLPAILHRVSSSPFPQPPRALTGPGPIRP